MILWPEININLVFQIQLHHQKEEHMFQLYMLDSVFQLLSVGSKYGQKDILLLSNSGANWVFM